ncbi:MAG: HNH endonuclease family protein, partial [bacterium]
ISLERTKDNPQKIFQSLNSTGLALTQSDLIRNYILMDLNPMNQKTIYDDYWKQIEDLTTIKETGESKLSDFIRDYLTIKYRDIPNKNKVFEKFNEKYPFLQDDIEKLKNLLEELKNYAYIYSKLIKPTLEKDIEISKNINYINRLELGVSYPFLMEVYKDYKDKKISKEIYIEVLELIQSYVWRRFIVGLPTNSLNKIFLKLYEDIDHDKYIESLQLSLIRKRGNQKFPNDDAISKELKIKDVYNIQQKNKNYFFELLENFKNPEYVKIEGNTDISIEHIFPQTPEVKWKYVLGEEYNKMMESLNTIANLTLSGFNSSLSNKYFTEKRDMPEKGYKFSRLFLNKFLAECEKWGLKELDERFELLFKRIIQIWSYPSLDIAIQSSKSAEINIFEIDDPTNKVIDYAIFFNKKIINISFIDLLHEVASFMFEEEPEKFFNSELKEKLNLTSDRKILRKCLQISPTQYIEGNLSAAEIIKRIKMIMEEFDINDEIYLKFKDE